MFDAHTTTRSDAAGVRTTGAPTAGVRTGSPPSTEPASTGSPDIQSRADLDADGPDPEITLFRAYLDSPTPTRRHELIERHMGLAVHLSRQFSRTGVSREDLRQTAMVGLVKSVDRFDPFRGSPFAPFARRVIEGELKRYIRDRSWSVHVPRSAQELHSLVRRGTENYTHRTGRSPTVAELAAHLEVEESDVLRGLAASAAFNNLPLPDEGAAAPRHTAALAMEDPGFDALDATLELRSLLQHLPERERRILELRFIEELTQTEIADTIGVSQMHVSRLLRRALERLRELRTE